MPQQVSFFGKQPPHIQELVLQQHPDRCAREMVEHLNTIGVHASEDDVRRFRRKNGVSVGWYYVVPPAATYDARTLQYIKAMASFCGKVFSNRVLGLKGGIWIRCARRLSDAGLIKRYDNRTPAKYVRLVSDAEIAEWYSREIGGK